MKVKYDAPRIIETAQITLNFKASRFLFELVVNSLAEEEWTKESNRIFIEGKFIIYL